MLLECILCGADGGPDMTTIMWRVNKTGEKGLFACTECRPYFGKALQNTDDVLTRVADIKSKLPRAFGGHNAKSND